jgi:hypothetical protein
MNKTIIAAAAILGASIVLSVLLVLKHEDAVRLQEQRRIACEGDKKAFDHCMQFMPAGFSPVVAQQCKESWQPQIAQDCNN